ncbi:TIGR02453 family protein [Frondihabitans australicus]|uniref:Uncharacterized protein (TIGR02453 family) n=1 Tax=Frondihabitans australicus TaxID=386892 RepID=A0A495IH06_9MICO|nr:DUF2461 domain-containing protein [Frondihabitans australicus]RKR75049.1 uncharacterized protein (TIGR02453 family) [Frondihabitans australicus]
MTFTGFTAAASEFFAQLARHNSREWFDAHRAQYIDAVRQPMEDLLGEAEAAYGPGHLTRPNRDLRFRPDKSPYRTWASMWAGTVGGVHLGLGADGLLAGGGLYEPTRDQLERARSAIDSVPLAASRLEAIVDDLAAAGFEMAGPRLKTAPRGYDRDHPRIDLLRLTHYAATERLPVTASPDEIRAAWSAVGPLVDWAREYAKAAEPGR